MSIDGLLFRLISPTVLAFLLGIIARWVKSDLRIPDELHVGLTIDLLVAVGLKGGYRLFLSTFGDLWKAGTAALLIGLSIPVWAYAILRRLGKLPIADAAAIAAHFGLVSAVTFSTALAFHDGRGLPEEGFMPDLLTIMEAQAILVALFIGRVRLAKEEPGSYGGSTGAEMRELLAGRSSLLLVGFLLIGWMIGETGWNQVAPCLMLRSLVC